MKKEEIAQKVIEILSSQDRSFKLNELSKTLEMKSDSPEYFLLKDVLEMLVKQEVLQKSARRQYSLAKNSFSELSGKIEIFDDQATVETGNEQIPIVFIKRNCFHTALNGDLVEVRLLANKSNKKPKGEVVKVIERNPAPIVGKIEYDGYFYFLVSDDKNHYVDFLVPQKQLNGAKHGDKVSAAFSVWDDPSKSPKAEVTKVLGSAGDPKVEYDAIIDEFALPGEFSDDVYREANKAKAPANKLPKGRRDMRDEIVITIDPIDAKDFDDALSLKKIDNGNYLLGIHIADVSHYVTENSALDIEARNRANSIYLVDRVIPMLPEALSNEVCSLKPDQPRYTFSVFAELTPAGILKDYTVEQTLIKSSRRYNYDEVQDIIDTGKGDYAELILDLFNLTQLLRSRRFKAGGIQFNTVEYKFLLDENYYPTEVVMKSTTESTSLVEECMLLANQIVAGHLKKLTKQNGLRKNLPYLYRVHDEPDQKILKEVLQFISTFGPKINKKVITSKDINELLEFVEDMPERRIVHQVLIRSMPKAIYSETNIGHYGLGFKEYSHFTSPIRRYPDLLVHRLIKEYSKEKPDKDRITFLTKLTKSVGNHSSNRERLALEAERASNKVAFAIVAENHIGEEFSGIITGVTAFGLFVQLDGIFAEGLLHIKDMHEDYYIHDEANYRIIGKRSRKIYKLGGRIRVKLIKVNIEKRQIDLEFVGD